MRKPVGSSHSLPPGVLMLCCTDVQELSEAQGHMGTRGRQAECYHSGLWAGPGACLSICSGQSIAGVLENQCGAGGFPLGVENYHRSEGGSIKVGCRVL